MAIVIHSYILTALTQLLCMRLLCRIKHGIESMFIVVVRTVNMCQSNVCVLQGQGSFVR
jgi:hypothetical protein